VAWEVLQCSCRSQPGLDRQENNLDFKVIDHKYIVNIELCVVEELRSGRLVELKTAGLALERPLYTLKLRGRHLSRSALAFLEVSLRVAEPPGRNIGRDLQENQI
jgi:hypothetical protein